MWWSMQRRHLLILKMKHFDSNFWIFLMSRIINSQAFPAIHSTLLVMFIFHGYNKSLYKKSELVLKFSCIDSATENNLQSTGISCLLKLVWNWCWSSRIEIFAWFSITKSKMIELFLFFLELLEKFKIRIGNISSFLLVNQWR